MARLESFVSDTEIEALYRPTGEARGLPARAYVDEEFWHLEREKLFPRTWMACAYESDVPEPGDVCPLSIAGWELILTRNREGVVNVFHNVCSIDVLQAEFETAFVPVAGRVSPSGITGQVVNSVNETSSYVVGSMHQGMQYVMQCSPRYAGRGRAVQGRDQHALPVA